MAFFLSWLVLVLAFYTTLPEKFIKKKIDDEGLCGFLSKHIELFGQI
jgi:hypothetical protein